MLFFILKVLTFIKFYFKFIKQSIHFIQFIFIFTFIQIQYSDQKSMGEDYIPSAQENKQKRYQHVVKAFQSLLDPQTHPISNLSNFIALLKQEFKWLWIGFYFVSSQHSQLMLQLGPFQGPLACTKIRKGKGVCGSSWQKQQTIIVADVQKFPGHIACSSISKSQIVIPLFHQKKVIGVLDIDSEQLNTFDQLDEKYLWQMIKLMESTLQFKWISQKF